MGYGDPGKSIYSSTRNHFSSRMSNSSASYWAALIPFLPVKYNPTRALIIYPATDNIDHVHVTEMSCGLAGKSILMKKRFPDLKSFGVNRGMRINVHPIKRWTISSSSTHEYSNISKYHKRSASIWWNTRFAVMRWRFTTDLYKRALVLLVNAVIALHETVLEGEFQIQVLHSEQH